MVIFVEDLFNEKIFENVCDWVFYEDYLKRMLVFVVSFGVSYCLMVRIDLFVIMEFGDYFYLVDLVI